MKECTGCRLEKDPSFFWTRKASPDGLSYKCKDCLSRYSRDRYANVAGARQEAKSRARKWALLNPERRRKIAHRSDQNATEERRSRRNEQARAQYKKNAVVIREKARIAQKHFRAMHPELVAQRNKLSRRRAMEVNPENERLRYRVQSHARRLRHKDKRSDAEILRIVLASARGACSYCGDSARLTVDHIDPLSRGGDGRWDNLLAACVSCNCSKGARVVEDWLYEKHGLEGLARSISAMKVVKAAIKKRYPAAIHGFGITES